MHQTEQLLSPHGGSTQQGKVNHAANQSYYHKTNNDTHEKERHKSFRKGRWRVHNFANTKELFTRHLVKPDVISIDNHDSGLKRPYPGHRRQRPHTSHPCWQDTTMKPQSKQSCDKGPRVRPHTVVRDANSEQDSPRRYSSCNLKVSPCVKLKFSETNDLQDNFKIPLSSTLLLEENGERRLESPSDHHKQTIEHTNEDLGGSTTKDVAASGDCERYTTRASENTKHDRVINNPTAIKSETDYVESTNTANVNTLDNNNIKSRKVSLTLPTSPSQRSAPTPTVSKSNQQEVRKLSRLELLSMRCVTDGLHLIHHGLDYVKDVLAQCVTHHTYPPFTYVERNHNEEVLSCFYIMNGVVEATYVPISGMAMQVYEPNIIYTHGPGKFINISQ